MFAAIFLQFPVTLVRKRKLPSAVTLFYVLVDSNCIALHPSTFSLRVGALLSTGGARRVSSVADKVNWFIHDVRSSVRLSDGVCVYAPCGQCFGQRVVKTWECRSLVR